MIGRFLIATIRQLLVEDLNGKDCGKALNLLKRLSSFLYIFNIYIYVLYSYIYIMYISFPLTSPICLFASSLLLFLLLISTSGAGYPGALCQRRAWLHAAKQLWACGSCHREGGAPKDIIYFYLSIYLSISISISISFYLSIYLINLNLINSI